MDRVRMGFVGAGFMGQLAHIANYAQVPDCEMVALAEGRTELARKVAARYGIAKLYRDHKELAADPDVEAVAAIMHYRLNYAVVKDLLEAGKHVITEKPITVSMAEADELVALAQTKGLIYQVGYMKRHDTGVTLARETIEQFRQSGEYGVPELARVWCFGGDWLVGIEDPIRTDEQVPDYGYQGLGFPEWISAQHHALFNRLLNLYSHVTNLLRYLIGEDYALEHVAWKPDKPFVVSGWSESDIHCVFECSDLKAARWYEGVELHFPQAAIRIDTPAPMARQTHADVTVYTMGDWPELRRPIPRPSWAFLEQARHFVACVRGEVPPCSPASDAAKDIALAEAAIRLVM